MIYQFDAMLESSMGERISRDSELIIKLLHGCISVEQFNHGGNDNGVDFIATLRGGTRVNIDVKTRVAGCSKYWRGVPELAIEKWSVMPGGEYHIPSNQAKAGWTLDESKLTDLVLYTFDPADSTMAYLIPFQSLRLTARRMLPIWMARHKVDIQKSAMGGSYWQSQAVFVPANEVIRALGETFACRVP